MLALTRPRMAVLIAAVATFALLPMAPASAQTWDFVKLADSQEEGFDPFGFGCASINAPGDIAFRAERFEPDGSNTTPGIYRANASDASLTTIVENRRRFRSISANPSMNDRGVVSFAATHDDGSEAIMRGRGGRLAVLASTRAQFLFFGFDTSVNDAGRVAFKAELDPRFDFDEGLFSARHKGAVTTHYLASSSQFDGTDARPSINDHSVIAFGESVDFNRGIFKTAGDDFVTIAPPDPDGNIGYGEPQLNNAGTAAFERSYFDVAADEFVSEIVTGAGGPITVVADTRGEFSFFGFRPPSLNDHGGIAFHATLDDFETHGIFTGPDPVADRVIVTGDTLDGATVRNITFCEEGLSEFGELGFVAALDDADAPEGFRVAVFRATRSATPE